MHRHLATGLVAWVLACAPSSPEFQPPLTVDAGVSCQGEQSLCLDHDTVRICSDGRLDEFDCPSGTGCFQGHCERAMCSDECTLGAREGNRVCEVFDMSTGEWTDIDSATSLHDRARDYTKWLHRDSLPYGGVVNAGYADQDTYEQVAYYSGVGDSAIWTGTYLAAEALRLKATGSADARANVIETVETLHLWFNVAGDPGLLVRYARPSDAEIPAKALGIDCENDPASHCNVPYKGKRYDYIGQISRDQYQGVMMGYTLAYEALGPNDEATRALIREDVVELVEELMKERVVPIKLTIDGTQMEPFDVKFQFVVLDSDELQNGALNIFIDTKNPNGNSGVRGFQEFIPDFTYVTNQSPLLDWVPVLPRFGSAVMLASFFQTAMLVTKDVKGFEDEHQKFATFYEGNESAGGTIDDWLDIALLWQDDPGCGADYYSNNILMEPLYNLARLESDPDRRERILTSLLHDTLWSAFRTTKNVFFTFIYSGTNPDQADPTAAVDAVAQLAGFPPPPRVLLPVDLRDDPRYPSRDPQCENQLGHEDAIDVADRWPEDFLWQRHPWVLVRGGNPTQTFPGVDYLVAYWLGRHHDFIEDDTPSRCLVWREP